MRKKLLALVSAVAIGIAMFAAVGMLSSPQQTEASHKVVLKFGGVVGAPGFPIQVGGQVSGVDFDNLTGQSFDNPIQVFHRFYCTIEITSSSWDGADVVTLIGEVIMSNNPNPAVVGTPVTWTVNLATGEITFLFGTMEVFTGTGHVHVAGHP